MAPMRAPGGKSKCDLESEKEMNADPKGSSGKSDVSRQSAL
jgi:hypothetical protein